MSGLFQEIYVKITGQRNESVFITFSPGFLSPQTTPSVFYGPRKRKESLSFSDISLSKA